MTEPLLTHLANLAGDEGFKLVLDAALEPVKAAIAKSIRRLFRLRDPHEDLRVEIARINESLQTLQENLRHVAASSTEQINAEAQEPAFKAFAERAFTMAANSTLESKRRLAGALIAQRLQVKTDTSDEIALRRALAVIEDLTENQLLVLAAAHLVNFGPALDPANATFSSRDALETYLRPRYLKVVQQLFDTLHLDEHEYGVLASVGAIRLSDQPETMLGYREHASSIEMWQLQHGVMQYDGFEGDWGSKEAALAYHARFPTLTLLERLGDGTSRSSPDSQHRRLDDVILTPLGVTLGELVLRAVAGETAATP